MTWDNSYSYYQTRYGMMRLDRVREDGVAELHSLQTEALLLYAPITTLSNPVVNLYESRTEFNL